MTSLGNGGTARSGKRIDVNADLGEGVGDDEALLDIVTSANIATGAHAGAAARQIAPPLLLPKRPKRSSMSGRLAAQDTAARRSATRVVSRSLPAAAGSLSPQPR